MQEIPAYEFARVLHHYDVRVQGYGKACGPGYQPVAAIVPKVILRVGSREPGAGRTHAQNVDHAPTDSQQVAHIGRSNLPEVNALGVDPDVVSVGGVAL